MATNSTSDGTAAPPGMESIADIRPTLRSLMLSHTFLTLLVPLIFALFHYSTPHSRRHPIFIFNVLAIVMAFANGILTDTAGIHGILSPQEMLPPMLYIWSGILGIFETMLVDLILLMRLVTVYPLAQVGLGRFALITFLPILLKVARFINVAVFLRTMSDLVNASGMDAIARYFALPFLKIEWAAQVVDNAYASTMFLWTIRGLNASIECPSNCSEAVQPTLGHRLRFLSRIALSNFVIPTLFSLCQFVISFCNVPYVDLGDVIYVNNMISVYGVVFASAWAGKESRRNWKDARRISGSYNSQRRLGGIGTFKAATGPMSTDGENTMGDVLDGNEPDFLDVDLEVGHDAAISPAKQY